MDIPGAKAWRTVASLYVNPGLHKEFELLPESAQQEVLAKVREKILPPAEVTERRKNDFLNADYEWISKLREEIRSLQTPGEVYLYTRSYRRQEEINTSYGDEEWGTGYYGDVNYTAWNLMVGARKKERSGWSGDYQWGKSFFVSSGADGWN